MTEALQAPQAVVPSVLTAVGAYETHKGTDQPYETIAVQDLMTTPRTHVPKDKARWVLCSTYNGPDGRSHKTQEAKGEFVMLAVDIDQGNILGREVAKAVAGFVGKSQFLVYTSSSATAINRKWRVLIPLAMPEKFDTWLAIMAAMNNHLHAALGVEPDRALERAGQPIYLPNSAPRMDGAKPYEASDLKAGALFDWRAAASADAVLAVMQSQEDERQERERLQHEARQRMSQAVSSGSESSVIDQFNQANDLANVLAACGYKPGPRDSWRSPLQSTSSHATKIHDDGTGQYWTSMSMSDFEGGVGRHARDGRSCFGDAFDVWCYFNTGNDRTEAIKAAAEQLGIKPAPTAAQTLAERIRANQVASNLASQPKAQQPAQPEQPQEQQDDQTTGEVIEFPAPAAKPVAAWEPWEDAPSETPINPTLAPASQPQDGTRILSFVQASQLPNWEPPQELVEGMLIEGGMTVVYGDSNTGKSFLVLDMVAHISLGRPWFGKRVKKRAVVYLAAESPRSIMDRARALEEQLGTKLDDLFIVNCPIDLHDPNGDTAAVVDTIEAIERDFNVSIGCVVADTLARVMGGGDENKAIDMGIVVKHIDLIRAATQAQFVVIHHTGKDSARGARGSSSLRAATDTEIEVSDPGNGNPKEFKVTKQRDLPGKNDVQGFTLTTVNLGVGVFDNLITTCVVEAAEAIPKDPTDSLKDGELEILDLLRGSTTGGLRYQQIIDQMQTVSIPTAKRYIRSLRKQGLIYEQSGQYRVGNGKTNGRQPGSEF